MTLREKITELIAAGKIAPRPLTRRQMRLWLLQSAIPETAITAAIGAIPDPATRAAAVIEWEDAETYHLDHPLLQSLGASIGLSADQLRAAFIAAAEL